MASSPHFETRFNGKVEHYRSFRPSYSREILPLLQHECSLTPQSHVVDVAAGTGLFAELFLENGNPVTAVEPNPEMRSACAALQTRYPKLTIAEGTAEHTGLPSSSADLLTVAQALHWFQLDTARREFARLLRPRAFCVITYNHRCMGGDRFHDAYEQLLRNYGIDYSMVRQRHLPDDVIQGFFAPSVMRRHSFPNEQALNLAGLTGRILSSSYMPKAGHPAYSATLATIEKLFDENQQNGFVHLRYDCTIYYGQL